jgi:hypothetical protein
MRTEQAQSAETTDHEWVTFPGGELEGKRPKALCAACREALRAAAQGCADVRPRRTLCFQCYRTELERERALRAAGERDTASVERFQFQLPFEPVNRPRLAALKTERQQARAATPPTTISRRHAQIEARHALSEIREGLAARGLSPRVIDRHHAIFEAVRAAELQLPESWLPFVVAR